MGTVNRWWLTLIGLGMVAYGGTAVWGLMDWRSNVFDFLVPVVIAAVGAVALVFEFLPEPYSARSHILRPAVEPFVLAWRRLWGTKWLLWVYGSVAAVSALTGIIQWTVFVLRWPERMSDYAPSDSVMVLRLSWFGLSDRAHGALSRFVPTIATIEVLRGSVLLAVVVMVSLFWILPRVARLRREPDYSGKVGFFGFCLVLLALACLFLMCAYVLQVRSVLVSRSEGRSSWVASSRGSTFRYPTGPLRAQTARRAASSPSAPAIVQSEDRPLSIRAYWFPNQNVINVVRAIADIILCAALVGGILGGLFRSRKGEEISRDTFLRDSVRHFEPLAAVYLLFWSLTGFLPMLLFLRTAPWPKWCLPILGMLSILSILLMYAPFGVVTQGLGFAGAIRHSLRVWKSTLWGTTRLIAVGSLFFVLSRALNYALPEIVVRTSWLAILRSPIHALISVAAQALITLAVWEFYSKNVLQPEQALEERG